MHDSREQPASAIRTMGAPRRVMHFVTGGFSGATQVAVDLCHAARAPGSGMEAILVLRRKRNTDEARLQALRDKGLTVYVVPGWSHLATIWALFRLCRQLQPDQLVAHGFSEHLWGRYAGLLAGVRTLVHIEHNSRERYTRWRLAQARWLAERTALLIGVSEGVRGRLIELGFPAQKCVAVPNGIDLSRFARADEHPFEQRTAGIVMSARFARQKDHLTLIRAVDLLAKRGLRLPLMLAGSGKEGYRRAAEALVKQLGLEPQVRFLGHHGEMPQLLMSQAVCVLSTHYEGMPLALVEGMAAGCACIASDVVGVSEVIEKDVTGILVPEGDPVALADALERVFSEPGLGERLARAARQRALQEHGLELMRLRYQALLTGL
ncbi:glycosyltransferase [Paucibacter sp. APW11]|uniref:Glycosyltransferase n=1 Tax=Roseateles aquae TaxID=3077235 RepID=A0ABU3P683_9BURK|nr:glycosyltransferase [Paucibacter sp. APW11]MDT8998079.1 glycosyltransferase [Paucibacter sp. APW11]